MCVRIAIDALYSLSLIHLLITNAFCIVRWKGETCHCHLIRCCCLRCLRCSWCCCSCTCLYSNGIDMLFNRLSHICSVCKLWFQCECVYSYTDMCLPIWFLEHWEVLSESTMKWRKKREKIFNKRKEKVANEANNKDIWNE